MGGGDGDGDTDTEGDGDTDVDGDTDTDADGDGDSDIDTDSDSDGDTHCDDGTSPSCRTPQPVCDAEWETLAVQGSCWACVSSVTCKPWGEAGCKTDGDCTPPEVCEQCATGSCPGCEDCVAGCVAPRTATDTDRETDTKTDTDGPTTVAQQPVMFRIVNNSTGIKYLWGSVPVVAEMEHAGDLNTIALNPPDCAFHCDTVNPGDHCCIDCEYNPSVIAILPGEYYEHRWDGSRTVYHEAPCSDCSCYTQEDPLAGDYAAYINAYDEASCSYGSCEPVDTTGRHQGWDVNGDSARFETPFTVLYEDNVVIIEIWGGRDTSCDDGSTVVCDKDQMSCLSPEERLAIYEGCWECVSSFTCKPWGVPGCVVDDDCEGWETCNECAIGSCPGCLDCVPGCVALLD